jgi:hypothetical protein
MWHFSLQLNEIMGEEFTGRNQKKASKKSGHPSLSAMRDMAVPTQTLESGFFGTSIFLIIVRQI